MPETSIFLRVALVCFIFHNVKSLALRLYFVRVLFTTFTKNITMFIVFAENMFLQIAFPKIRVLAKGVLINKERPMGVRHMF